MAWPFGITRDFHIYVSVYAHMSLSYPLVVLIPGRSVYNITSESKRSFLELGRKSHIPRVTFPTKRLIRI